MAWEYHQRYRLAQEEKILKLDFPHFQFLDKLGNTYVRGAWQTSYGNSYEITITLPPGYPEEMPSTYVSKPSPLRGYKAAMVESVGTSHAMHVFRTDRPGWTKLCIFREERWTGSHTVAKMILKAMLWLEAFDCHIETGKDVSDFLLTMQ